MDFPTLHESGCAESVQRLLTSDHLRAIFRVTAQWVGARGVDASALLDEIDDDNPARGWLESRLALQAHANEAEALRTVERVLHKLERDRFKREDRRLKREILEARRAGDDERAEELTRRMMELFRSARASASRGAEGTKR